MKSLAECITKGLNPNPNPPGELVPMTDTQIDTWASGILGRLKQASTTLK